MVENQGGDTSVIKDINTYKKAKLSDVVKANKDGFINKLDSLKAGLASVELGCGRRHVQDKIDYSAGILLQKKIGDEVRKGDTIFSVSGEAAEKVQNCIKLLEESIEIVETKPEVKSKIIEVID